MNRKKTAAALTLLLCVLTAARAQQSGSGARGELLQSLTQRYPITSIGPSVLGLRGGEDTIRQVGGIVVVQREGFQGATDRKLAPICLIRGENIEVTGGKGGEAIHAGGKFYVHSLYVGADVVEFGLLSTQPAGAGRVWARAVFFFPPDVLHNGDRPTVIQQIDRWLAPENAAGPIVAVPPAAPPPTAVQRAKLEPDMTRAEVVRVLGEPTREVSFGARLWLVYSGMVVFFEDDKLKSVEHNGRPARVRIRTEPEGAEIYIGEQLVGQGPTTLDLPAGRYVFLVRQPGYLPWRKEVDVLSGADISLVAPLQKQ